MNELEKKQDRLMKSLPDYFDFISCYSEVYYEQAKSPYKVFPRDVPFMSEFGVLFPDFLLKFVQRNLERPNDIEKRFQTVESVILSTRQHEYRDDLFLDVCHNAYITALLFLMERCEYEVMNYDFESNMSLFLKCFRLLYEFSGKNIDLNSLFIDKCLRRKYDVKKMADTIVLIDKIIGQVNDVISFINFRTKFADDELYLEKLRISGKLIGDQPVVVYSIARLIRSIVDSLFEDKSISTPDSYVLVMNLISEMTIKEIGNDDLYQKIKEVSHNMIEKATDI